MPMLDRRTKVCLLAIIAATGCMGEIGASTPDSGGAGTGAGSGVGGSSGTAGASGGGGTIPDPFSVAPTCTSGVTWTRGNAGSELMNPGRACIDCHSMGGDGPAYSIAGTVYPSAHEPDLCNGADGASGVVVTIVGADGLTQTLTPNSAGNFGSRSAVAFPYRAKVSYMGRERAMAAMQTTGDCNTCHTQSGANSAPGRILLP